MGRPIPKPRGISVQSIMLDALNDKITEDAKKQGIAKIYFVEKCINEYLKSKPKSETVSFDLKRKIYDELLRLRKKDRLPMGKTILEFVEENTVWKSAEDTIEKN